jgi:hypothetical protein
MPMSIMNTYFDIERWEDEAIYGWEGRKCSAPCTTGAINNKEVMK